MAVSGMEHFTVLTDDLERTQGFYREFLGLEPGPRPAFAFPGAWLYSGGHPVLHIIAGRALPAQRAGVIDHMAFAATDLAGTLARLKRHGIAFELRQPALTGAWQLFFLDPNGAKVELDFPAGETEGAA